MHLLFIGINYAPEMTSVAPFTTGLCENLVALGHRVSVITAFPYYPEWRIHDRYRGIMYKREQIRGVDVRRVIHFIPSKPRNLVQRLLHDITFSFNALLAISLVGTFDGIFCSSPPPFVPTVASIASRLYNVSFAINLTDLALNAAASLGMMGQKSFLGRLALLLEKFNYRQARGIAVLCEGFRNQLVDLGVSQEKISIVPTWADIDLVRPLPRDNNFRRQNDLAIGDFMALHTGNMGLKQGLQTVVDAANISNSKIKWILIGDGEEREMLQKMSRQYVLKQLGILPLQPPEVFPFVLASADVLLLVQRSTVTDSVIPSKLLTYMSAGRPIVASVNAESESARRIREADCGWVIPPEDPTALALAVDELRKKPEEAKRLGLNGRIYVEENFAKDHVLSLYDSFLGRVFSSFKSEGSNGKS